MPYAPARTPLPPQSSPHRRAATVAAVTALIAGFVA